MSAQERRSTQKQPSPSRFGGKSEDISLRRTPEQKFQHQQKKAWDKVSSDLWSWQNAQDDAVSRGDKGPIEAPGYPSYTPEAQQRVVASLKKKYGALDPDEVPSRFKSSQQKVVLGPQEPGGGRFARPSTATSTAPENYHSVVSEARIRQLRGLPPLEGDKKFQSKSEDISFRRGPEPKHKADTPTRGERHPVLDQIFSETTGGAIGGLLVGALSSFDKDQPGPKGESDDNKVKRFLKWASENPAEAREKLTKQAGTEDRAKRNDYPTLKQERMTPRGSRPGADEQIRQIRAEGPPRKPDEEPKEVKKLAKELGKAAEQARQSKRPSRFQSKSEKVEFKPTSTRLSPTDRRTYDTLSDAGKADFKRRVDRGMSAETAVAAAKRGDTKSKPSSRERDLSNMPDYELQDRLKKALASSSPSSPGAGALDNELHRRQDRQPSRFQSKSEQVKGRPNPPKRTGQPFADYLGAYAEEEKRARGQIKTNRGKRSSAQQSQTRGDQTGPSIKETEAAEGGREPSPVASRRRVMQQRLRERFDAWRAGDEDGPERARFMRELDLYASETGEDPKDVLDALERGRQENRSSEGSRFQGRTEAIQLFQRRNREQQGRLREGGRAALDDIFGPKRNDLTGQETFRNKRKESTAQAAAGRKLAQAGRDRAIERARAAETPEERARRKRKQRRLLLDRSR